VANNTTSTAPSLANLQITITSILPLLFHYYYNDLNKRERITSVYKNYAYFNP